MFSETNIRIILLMSLATLMIISGISSRPVSAQSNLLVEGHIIGYEIKSFNLSSMVSAKHILFVVTKVIDGREKSEYIKVLSLGYTER